MNSDSALTNAAFGFLTVIEHSEHGLFGGYLVINTVGRPLEFLCTAPIRPNRAQEILYGPTLKPYLFGEQIGQTLLDRSKIDPLAICTDRESVLSVRDHIGVPIALVLPPAETDVPEPARTFESKAQEDRKSDLSDEHEQPGGLSSPLRANRWRADPSHRHGHALVTFLFGQNRLAVPKEAQEDCRRIEQRLGALVETFDLTEPFDRIREAIEEARRGG